MLSKRKEIQRKDAKSAKGFIMVKVIGYLLGLGLIICVPLAQAQISPTILTAADGNYWTLPDICNDCEIRVSPQGTLYHWDRTAFVLYRSIKNAGTFDVYRLEDYAEHLIFITDFIPLDAEGYVVFFSPPGASRALARYDLNTGQFDIVQFPEGYDLVACNRYTAVTQHTLRSVLRVGLDGVLVACTDSPEYTVTLQVIDIHSFSIEKSIHTRVGFYDVIQPLWTIHAGWDNRIYAVTSIASVFDATSEALLQVYDMATDQTLYSLMPMDTYEILEIDSQSNIFMQVYTPQEHEVLQYDAGFRLVRQFSQPGTYVGMTLDGTIFFIDQSKSPQLQTFNLVDIETG